MPDTLAQSCRSAVSRGIQLSTWTEESILIERGGFAWERLPAQAAPTVSRKTDTPYGRGVGLQNIFAATLEPNRARRLDRFLVELLGGSSQPIPAGNPLSKLKFCPVSYYWDKRRQPAHASKWAISLAPHDLISDQGQLVLNVSPLPDPETQLGSVLEELESLVRREKAFDEELVSQVRELLATNPAVRAKLLRVACGEEYAASGQSWSARLRWFALDKLRHWSVPGYIGSLVQAVETWSEDYALYGAVVAVRYQKVSDDEKERLRAALEQRLERKRSADDWRSRVFDNQLVGQMLATYSSFAQAQNLELLGSFGLYDYAFPVRSNALEAMRRVACRYAENPITDAYFRQSCDRVSVKCVELANNRRAGEYMGSLLWSTVAVLICRLGDEALYLQHLETQVAEFPAWRADFRRELDKAENYLRRINKAAWLESRNETVQTLRAFLHEDAAANF